MLIKAALGAAFLNMREERQKNNGEEENPALWEKINFGDYIASDLQRDFGVQFSVKGSEFDRLGQERFFLAFPQAIAFEVLKAGSGRMAEMVKGNEFLISGKSFLRLVRKDKTWKWGEVESSDGCYVFDVIRDLRPLGQELPGDEVITLSQVFSWQQNSFISYKDERPRVSIWVPKSRLPGPLAENLRLFSVFMGRRGGFKVFCRGTAFHDKCGELTDRSSPRRLSLEAQFRLDPEEGRRFFRLPLEAISELTSVCGSVRLRLRKKMEGGQFLNLWDVRSDKPTCLKEIFPPQ